MRILEENYEKQKNELMNNSSAQTTRLSKKVQTL